jgi:hypothetical protein
MLPPSALATSTLQRQQNDVVAQDGSQGQRNRTSFSQSLSPEFPGLAESVCRMREERDAARYTPDGPSEQTYQQMSTSSGLQLTESNRTETCFVPPTLPSVSYLDIMYNYYADELKCYLKFLGSLTVYEYKMYGKHPKVTKLAHGYEPRLYNDWLLSLLPVSSKEIQIFRSLAPPKDYDYSLLARCIRFALSPAEKQFSWTVHPQHIALIMERTDEHGKVRTIEREVEEKMKNRRIIDGMKRVFALVRLGKTFEEFLGLRRKCVVQK